MTMCWKKKTPLSIAQALKIGMASHSSWLACQTIGLWGSGNYPPPRIWAGLTITNCLSSTGVKTSTKEWDDSCGSQTTPSISVTPLCAVLTAIHHRDASIRKCTLWTGGGRHR
jgi:hypothetical protein